MTRITVFAGINNVADPTRLKNGELEQAVNVDLDSRSKVVSAPGRVRIRAGVASSVFESPFGIFAQVDNDLLLLDSAGDILRTVYPTLGYTRVWYVLLPDGRVGFSNGLINGLASATITTSWGVPAPDDAGSCVPGDTAYQITYIRQSDGREGPPRHADVLADVKQPLLSLPQRAGYDIAVYVAPYGDQMFLAGRTSTDVFAFPGTQLGLQYQGSASLVPPPAGRLMCLWGSRILSAQGNVVWMTAPLQPELCDAAKDFVQMPETVTLLYANESGIFVGTTEGLYFLAGSTRDELSQRRISAASVVLGSGVRADLSFLNDKVRPKGAEEGAYCLTAGAVHLLYSDGQVLPLTADTYRTSVDEVHAAVRVRDGYMQYIAAPA